MKRCRKPWIQRDQKGSKGMKRDEKGWIWLQHPKLVAGVLIESLEKDSEQRTR